MGEDTRRVRFGSIVEWALAAALLVSVVAVGSAFLREVRTVRPVVPVIAGEPHLYYDAPAAIPARAVALPVYMLENGRDVHVGDKASSVARALGTEVALVSESVERTPSRQRVVRFYVDSGVQFALVFEAPESGVEPTVAAIYLP